MSAAAATQDRPKVATASEVIVRGGTQVRVLQVESMLRLEMSGIAQGSGRAVDRIWGRILAPGTDGIGRLAVGVVRGAGWLQIGD
jgi:hypothetical protein